MTTVYVETKNLNEISFEFKKIRGNIYARDLLRTLLENLEDGDSCSVYTEKFEGTLRYKMVFNKSTYVNGEYCTIFSFELVDHSEGEKVLYEIYFGDNFDRIKQLLHQHRGIVNLGLLSINESNLLVEESNDEIIERLIECGLINTIKDDVVAVEYTIDFDYDYGLYNVDCTLEAENCKAIPKNKRGFYIIHNERKEIIYVGKSKDLQARLVSHINGLTHTSTFTDKMRYISIIIIDDEKYNMNSESGKKDLIKTLRPKYNKTFNVA